MKKLLALLLALATAFTMLSCGIVDKLILPGENWNTESFPTNSTESTEPADALSALRADMLPPVMAVADLGFPTLSETFSIQDYLLEEYPRWTQANAFIRDMPQQRIVIACSEDAWAQLLCIVPKDPASSVSVEVVRYLETPPYTQTEEVYRSETGEPILLLAEISDSVDVSVTVTDSQGRGLSWMPYWETYQVIPEDTYPGAMVMYFTPESERTFYDSYLEAGWVVPDASFLRDHFFQSGYTYQLELIYAPGELYDGEATIYEPDEAGNYVMTYLGAWRYAEGKLHLDMVSDFDGSIGFRGDFPILLSPYDENYPCIFRTEEGLGLPQFYDDMWFDEVLDTGSIPPSPYEYALFCGWRIPEPQELTNTIRSSENGYVLDLMDSGVALIYEVGENGEYNTGYSGSWEYADGMLHLNLLPQQGDGAPVEGSFPVLILDLELWIGRAANGLCLPYFYADQHADILTLVAG